MEEGTVCCLLDNPYKCQSKVPYNKFLTIKPTRCTNFPNVFLE